MSQYTQTNRPLAIKTGLKPEPLLLVSFSGDEAVSQLFHFHLHLLAENRTEVPFADLLGRSITVELELPGSQTSRERKRFFNGLCYRLTQGERGAVFTTYRMELVPEFWRLTKRAQSRTFQHLSVKEILAEVLQGIKTDPRMAGPFAKRDYCVQYRETDFNFACRLMEEEGIYYYFTHADGAHTLVLGDALGHHLPLPEPAVVTFRAAQGGDGYSVCDWEKVQELRAGRCTLRDHTFEKPQDNLNASRPIQPDVLVGSVVHKLNGACNGDLEVYDYPGEYAQRFDGVDRGGGERLAEVAKIYDDKERTVQIRMQEEALPAVAVHGTGDCRHFTAGCRFALMSLDRTVQKQVQADGSYVLTAVQHATGLPGDSDGAAGFYYQNSFRCIPAALPFRPPRVTPKPVIVGTQTAEVVGAKDEEVCVDKYGRVKVLFRWDRQGKRGLDSSCWVRVAQFWAGRRWGGHFWPRVGQEVVVAFEEGDPDQPIIVGSVYNAENMPPYALPEHKTRSGVKTRSTPEGTEQHFNEIRFEDKKGAEELLVHAERDLTVVAEANENRSIGGQRGTTIGGDCNTRIGGDQLLQIDGKGGQGILISEGVYTLTSRRDAFITSREDIQLEADRVCKITGALTWIRAKGAIILECGGGGIAIDNSGNVYINGPTVNINSGNLPNLDFTFESRGSLSAVRINLGTVFSPAAHADPRPDGQSGATPTPTPAP